MPNLKLERTHDEYIVAIYSNKVLEAIRLLYPDIPAHATITVRTSQWREDEDEDGPLLTMVENSSTLTFTWRTAPIIGERPDALDTHTREI